jgi:hypothetical protein
MATRRMNGAAGVDMQRSRTMIVVTEGWQRSPVGDGHRRLVPNAQVNGLWGSPAAEAILSDGPPLPERLTQWRTDPWSKPFLTGVHDRLTRFLGQVRPIHANGYVVCLSIGPDAPDNLAELCASAGLTDTEAVEPGEALVCRWLTERVPGDWKGAVTSVACGENWTTATPYTVDLAGGRTAVTRTGPSAFRNVGGGAWCAEVAANVLERCREGIPATALLALLDGTLELGSALRARDIVEWTGPLTDQLFAPLTFTRQEMASRPSVEQVTGTIRDLVRVTASRPDLILVGGACGVWPFIPSALGDPSKRWQSREPEQDLAVGAACWPVLRPCFTGVPAAAARGGGEESGVRSRPTRGRHGRADH